MREDLSALARPLDDDASLDAILSRVGDASVVMLGEATHGTSEFYAWRTRITLRLVREKGFRFVAVEGDWPDCFRLNRYVKGDRAAGATAAEVADAFRRWPTWMWANAETVELLDALGAANDERASSDKVGFYGLDVYSLWESMRILVARLDEIDPSAAEAARAAWACFEPYGEDAQRYALATQVVGDSCRDAVVRALAQARRGLERHPGIATEAFLDAEQNAIVAVNAEAYYRAMVSGGPRSWNVRDTHMADTLDRLLERHGPGAKAIVWAHNTHVGDARATDMASAGLVNLGQLARVRRGADDVVLVGFSTYEGDVIAARAWDAPMRRLPVPPAQEESLEATLHEEIGHDAILVFPEGASALGVEPLGHRAIGVVYHPEQDRGHYVPTVVPERYDALLHVERSRAVRALHLRETLPELPETFPWGV